MRDVKTELARDYGGLATHGSIHLVQGDPFVNAAVLTHLDSGRRQVLVHGPEGSGKTTLVRTLASRLRDQKIVRFIEGREFASEEPSVKRELHAAEASRAPFLLVVENCHLMDDPEALGPVFYDQAPNVSVVLTSRDRGHNDPLLQLYPDIPRVGPDSHNLRVDIAWKNIQRRFSEYARAEAEKVHADIERLLSDSSFPKRDLKFLNLWLESWDPSRPLQQIDLDHLYPRLLIRGRLDDIQGRGCLLPVYAIAQFELSLHAGFLDSLTGINKFIDEGLLVESARYYRLPDPAVSIWYLRAAQHANYFSNLDDYVVSQLVTFISTVPEPDGTLFVIPQEIAERVLMDDSVSERLRLCAEQRSDRLPYLLYHLRKKGGALGSLLWADILHTFEPTDPEPFAASRISWLTRFLRELSNLQDGDQLLNAILGSQRLAPAVLSERIQDEVALGVFGTAEWRHLLKMFLPRDYDMRKVIEALPLQLLEDLVAGDPRIARLCHQALARGPGRSDLLGPESAFLGEVDVDHLLRRGIRGFRDLIVLDRTLARQTWSQLSAEQMSEVLAGSTIQDVIVLLHGVRKDVQFARTVLRGVFDHSLTAMLRGATLGQASLFSYLVCKLAPDRMAMYVEEVIDTPLSSLIERNEEPDRGAEFVSLLLRNIVEAEADPSSLLHVLSTVSAEWLEASTKSISYVLNNAVRATDQDFVCRWISSIPQETWQTVLLRTTDYVRISWYLLLCGLGDLLGRPAVRDRLQESPAGIGQLLLVDADITDQSSVTPDVIANEVAEALAKNSVLHAILNVIALKSHPSGDFRDDADALITGNNLVVALAELNLPAEIMMRLQEIVSP